MSPTGFDTPAVVVGLDCATGLQTSRILHARGVPVVGVARRLDHFACRTNTCRRVVQADLADGTALTAALLGLGRELGRKAVLVPCTDLTVLNISHHRDALSPYFHIALPEHSTVEMLLDKVAFHSFASAHEIPVPAAKVVATQDDAEAAARTLEFPCVVKPAVKHPSWEAHAPSKVVRVADAASWRLFAHEALGWVDQLLVQEWVAGEDDQLYSCNAYFGRSSAPLVTFVARKLRQWPPRQGTSALGEEARNDALLDLTVRLFQAAGFHGLAYVEAKVDARTGTPVVIEPNIGRPTGRSAIAELGGVELLLTMYCDLLDFPLPSRRTQQYAGVKWIYLRHDLQAAFVMWRRGELTLRQWLRSLRGVRHDAVFSLRDPRPFFEDLRTTLADAVRGRKRLHPADVPGSPAQRAA